MFAAASRGIPTFGDLAWKKPAEHRTIVGGLPACVYDVAAGTLTASVNGVLVINGSGGIPLTLNERVLVSGQATASQNGIYTITSMGAVGAKWVLTRALDANTVAKLPYGTTVFVSGDVVTGAYQYWMLLSRITTFNDNQSWYPLNGDGPHFAYYRAAVQSIPTTADTLVTFDTQQYGGTMFGAVPTDTLTIPTGLEGIWHFSAMADFAAHADTITRQLTILVRGNIAVRVKHSPAGSGPTVLGASIDFYCLAGDSVQLDLYQNSGVALNTSGTVNDVLYGHRVGMSLS